MTVESAPRLPAAPEGLSLVVDWVRGLASQMVVLGHALNIFVPALFMQTQGNGMMEARPGIFYIQNLGVILFFLLSGYLITASAQRNVKHGRTFADFAADRFARIFTPLLPALLIVWVGDNLLLWSGQRSPYTDMNAGAHDLFLNAAMLAGNPALAFAAQVTGLDWLSAPSFGSADQLWTVIVEWWIYMIFGAGFFFLYARQKSSLIGYGMAGSLVLIGVAALLGTAVNTPGLIIAWIAGMSAKLLSDRYPPACVRPAVWIAVASACVVAAGFRLHATSYNLYSPLATILMSGAFFAFFLPLLKKRTARGGGWVMRAGQFMADVSYSLYLIHFSVLIWMAALFPNLVSNPFAILIGLFVSNFLAWALYITCERHFRTVRQLIDPLVVRLGSAMAARGGR